MSEQAGPALWRCVCGRVHDGLWCPDCRLPARAGSRIDVAVPPPVVPAAPPATMNDLAPAPPPPPAFSPPAPPWDVPDYDPHYDADQVVQSEPEPEPEPGLVVQADEALDAVDVDDDVPAYEPVPDDEPAPAPAPVEDAARPSWRERRAARPPRAPRSRQRARPGGKHVVAVLSVAAGVTASLLVGFVVTRSDAPAIAPRPAGELAAMFAAPPGYGEAAASSTNGPVDLELVEQLAGTDVRANYELHGFRRGQIREWQTEGGSKVTTWLSEFQTDFDADPQIRSTLISGATSQPGARPFAVPDLDAAVGVLLPQRPDGSWVVTIVFVRRYFTVSIFGIQQTRPSAADGRALSRLAKAQYDLLPP